MTSRDESGLAVAGDAGDAMGIVEENESAELERLVVGASKRGEGGVIQGHAIDCKAGEAAESVVEAEATAVDGEGFEVVVIRYERGSRWAVDGSHFPTLLPVKWVAVERESGVSFPPAQT